MKNDTFSTYHPVINFMYFMIVIGVSMFAIHPVFLTLSCMGGLAYYVYLKGRKAIKTCLWLVIPVFLISAVINPLFNHEGITLICYFGTGNPLTLESIVYGMMSGLMLAAVLNWFSCYQWVMTSDKFVYLFGKMIPAMSLILSMIFRFIPRFRSQIEKISSAQKCIGRDFSDGNLMQKARHGMRILSIMTTWALENSVETADSMKSRGYGLRGRTNFSIYRFDSRDKILSFFLAGGGVLVLWGIISNEVNFQCYPMIKINSLSKGAVVIYMIYGIICLLPIAINIAEDIKWRYLKSKI